MAFKLIRKLPTPEEVREQFALTASQTQIKAANDKVLADIFAGKDDRFIFIIGPCSAHDSEAVLEYTVRLAKVQEQVKDKIILIPRIYTNKPRTLGTGYKGIFHQPNPEQDPNIVEGIQSIRKLHSRIVSETGLPVADEMLYPENHDYLSDILSYVAIGARSVENQMHRLVSSGVGIPVGMKNPMSGDIKVMLNSVQAAQASHDFSYNGYEVETEGNPLAHTIMRGALSMDGFDIPNYHYENLQSVANEYSKRSLLNPAIIVDTNHSNSAKKYMEQIRILKEILDTRDYSAELRKLVKGVMVESYLVGGAQKCEEGVFGKSITDPCIGWEDTERMILSTAERL